MFLNTSQKSQCVSFSRYHSSPGEIMPSAHENYLIGLLFVARKIMLPATPCAALQSSVRRFQCWLDACFSDLTPQPAPHANVRATRYNGTFTVLITPVCFTGSPGRINLSICLHTNFYSPGSLPCAASHSWRVVSQLWNAADLSAFSTSFRLQAMTGPAFSGLPRNSAIALSVQSRAFSPLLLSHSVCQ